VWLICRSLFCGLSWGPFRDLGMACQLADVDGRDTVTGSGLVRPRRSVAAVALAQARLASDPAVRSRLCAMAAPASQAVFAGNDPGGRWARGPSVRSASTCSAWAWSRWCSSAGERRGVERRVRPCHQRPAGFPPGSWYGRTPRVASGVRRRAFAWSRCQRTPRCPSLRQGHHRHQPRLRHEIRVIKRRMNLRQLG
jgi:hypothetical protein